MAPYKMSYSIFILEVQSRHYFDVIIIRLKYFANSYNHIKRKITGPYRMSKEKKWQIFLVRNKM
mgnify:CR=1 FL=1